MELFDRLPENFIQTVLPHTYPFLLVDKIEKYVNGKVICKKNITINEPFFQGHFPDNPILPGVLLIEMAAQTSALLYIMDYLANIGSFDISLLKEMKKKVGYLGSVTNFKFIDIVKPGDTLLIECYEKNTVNNVKKIDVKIVTTNKKIIAKGSIVVSSR